MPQDGTTVITGIYMTKLPPVDVAALPGLPSELAGKNPGYSRFTAGLRGQRPDRIYQ